MRAGLLHLPGPRAAYDLKKERVRPASVQSRIFGVSGLVQMLHFFSDHDSIDFLGRGRHRRARGRQKGEELIEIILIAADRVRRGIPDHAQINQEQLDSGIHGPPPDR